jgi:hypothetical protein
MQIMLSKKYDCCLAIRHMYIIVKDTKRFFHNPQVELSLSCGSYCFAIRASQTPPSAPPASLSPGVSCLALTSGIFPTISLTSLLTGSALFHLAAHALDSAAALSSPIPSPSPPTTSSPHSLPPSVLQPRRRRTFIHPPSSNTAAAPPFVQPTSTLPAHPLADLTKASPAAGCACGGPDLLVSST